MSTLSAIKSTHKHSKYAVFGYIREWEKKNKLQSNIPEMLIYLFLAYYFHGERFIKAGHDIQISKDKLQITKVFGANSKQNRSFGKHWISSICDKIIKWTFKINHIGEYSTIYIGLVTNDDDANSNNDFNAKYWIAIHGNRGMSTRRYKVNAAYTWSRGQSFKKNEELILNYNTGIQKFSAENKDGNLDLPICRNVAFGPDVRYKIAVCMENRNDKITLMDFGIFE